MSLGNDTLYRVSLDPIKNTVEISCIGMDRVDNSLDGTYLSVDDLPQWVQGRIALLMMTDPNPPSLRLGCPELEGVGRRVDKYTFWICDKKGWEMNYCVACYDDTDYSWTLDSHGYPDGEEFGKDSEGISRDYISKIRQVKIRTKVKTAHIKHLMGKISK